MLTHPLHSFAYAYFLSKKKIATKMHNVTVDFIFLKSKKKPVTTLEIVLDCVFFKSQICFLLPLYFSNIIRLFSSVN